ETAIPSSWPLLAGRIFAEISGEINTGVAIANPNGQAVTINFYYTRMDGTAAGSGTTVVPANGQVAAFLDQIPFNADPMVGAFTFSSTLPVSVIALREMLNERS